jgi:hypothetical protein
MLSADMQERASGRIELKDMTLRTGKELVHYLYNRHLRSDADHVALLKVRNEKKC